MMKFPLHAHLHQFICPPPLKVINIDLCAIMFHVLAPAKIWYQTYDTR